MGGFSLDFHPLSTEVDGITCALVPWDSEAFGLPVYELRIDETATLSARDVSLGLSSLDDKRGSLVCTKVDQLSVPLLCTLAETGFYSVETVIEIQGELAYGARLPRTAKIPVRLRIADEADMPEMVRIASTAFWSDRFHLDPNLSNAAADTRYARWVERAFSSNDLLFAYERTDESAIIGFYHVRKVDEACVDLVLAGIDPSLKGLGLGAVLYQLAVADCLHRGFHFAQTRVVARNLAVLNIFAAMRFSFRGALTSLHRFSSPMDNS